MIITRSAVAVVSANVFTFAFDELPKMNDQKDIPHSNFKYGSKQYARWFEIAGVYHRKEQVLAWAAGTNQTLSMVPETSNRHDPNAIKVIGHCRVKFIFFSMDRTFHIGYVTKEISAGLYNSGKLAEAIIHLDKVKIGEYINVIATITVPSN